MGSLGFYAEEEPQVTRRVDDLDVGLTAVTNQQFAQFVDETGYVTVAERPLDLADFGASASNLDTSPGSLVFVPTPGPVDLSDWRQWWRWVPGAQWRAPGGPGTSIEGKGEHPVVQVCFDDAMAFCTWAGARLPTEAEWEYAARGGLDNAVYAWGNEPQAADSLKANTWQGSFPYRNVGALGWIGAAPVRSFPPNGYGLFEMTGNTWEWTSSPWTATHETAGCGCSPQSESDSELRIVKGGSFLCAPEYCLRYRPAARSSQSTDSATLHIGFRVVRDVVG